MDIDVDIEKQIAQLQEAKLKENIEKVIPKDFDVELGAFFSTVVEEKKDLKEKVKKDEVKIKEFEEFFTNLTLKKKKNKKKKILLVEPEKPEEIVSQAKIADKELDESIISKVSKQLSEMQVATELDKNRIKKLEELNTLEKLKKEFLSFRDIVSKQMGTIGGGGETQLKYLDDVDSSSALIDKRVLQYDSATGKFIGTTLETEDLILNGTDASSSNAGDRLVLDGTDSSSSNAGDGVDLQDGTFGGSVDLSAVDQHIVPSESTTYDLGSSSKRWRDIYLSGNTIDLAGATISSDGSGTVSISADGVTLPSGSKVGTTTIAKASSNGISVTDVPFFSASDGLSTANKTFQFAAAGDSFAYTNTGTFILAAGTTLEAQDITLFKF